MRCDPRGAFYIAFDALDDHFKVDISVRQCWLSYKEREFLSFSTWSATGLSVYHFQYVFQDVSASDNDLK